MEYATAVTLPIVVILITHDPKTYERLRQVIMRHEDVGNVYSTDGGVNGEYVVVEGPIILDPNGKEKIQKWIDERYEEWWSRDPDNVL